ncbi:dihydropteroate synthase [Aristophania vespae]|uniref:dihydropteroate synthase n=2 Tax=Aristophania vespae TaxID=2697033 RepID=A0A6P1NFT7_9PROT|nr:dihydropteroate synthase [Aristophania vespae]
MGILNITPDSFSDGGEFIEADEACRQAHKLVLEGADIIDCGGESTRPGYTAISVEEEWYRLSSVIAPLAVQGICLSVDTMKAEVARRALRAGAVMVNDVWGLQYDPAMAAVVADFGANVVVMHNRQDIDPHLDLKADFKRFFDYSLEKAQLAGVSTKQIVLDPGVGFGKTPEQNLKAINLISWLRSYYQLPILLGVSRKSFFGHFLGRQKGERLAATIAANLYGVKEGASIIRVHDAQPHEDMVLLNYMLGNLS